MAEKPSTTKDSLSKEKSAFADELRSIMLDPHLDPLEAATVLADIEAAKQESKSEGEPVASMSTGQKTGASQKIKTTADKQEMWAKSKKNVESLSKADKAQADLLEAMWMIHVGLAIIEDTCEAVGVANIIPTIARFVCTLNDEVDTEVGEKEAGTESVSSEFSTDVSDEEHMEEAGVTGGPTSPSSSKPTTPTGGPSISSILTKAGSRQLKRKGVFKEDQSAKPKTIKLGEHTMYKCSSCGESCVNYTSVVAHINELHTDNVLECVNCPYHTFNPDSLKKHEKATCPHTGKTDAK